MRFRRVLLVSPPSASRYGGLRVPAGIGYVAQSLSDNAIDHEYLDMRIGYGWKDLKKKVKAYEPDLVGVSMITLGYKATYRLICDLKQLRPDCTVVVGGHHMTILKEKVLAECPAIDLGVVSEGEQTIVELCQGRLSYPQIKGLIYRDGDRIVCTEQRPPAEDLDQIAFPRYERFDLRDYSKQIPIQSSRGCVHRCTFCPNRMLGVRYRARSPENFVDEIEYWYGRGFRQFAIDDDNFTFDNRRVHQICDQIERRGLRGLMIRCSNGLRADRVDRQLLARMKEIGVREVGFGVDGGNDRVLKHLKKGETIETIERAIAIACDLGLDVKIFIIVGTPHETEADIEDSIRLGRKYPVARVNYNNAIPYPGTEMFDHVEAHDLFLIPPEEYLNSTSEEKTVPVFETPELPRAKRIELLGRCHEVEKEVMKNTALRMYGRHPVWRYLIQHCFNVTLFEKLFFKNLFFRRIFEWIRYRKLVPTQM
ncbi:MAG: B12-binding domain-containing radical SAM protein [Planctomycetota bacterium]